MSILWGTAVVVVCSKLACSVRGFCTFVLVELIRGEGERCEVLRSRKTYTFIILGASMRLGKNFPSRIVLYKPLGTIGPEYTLGFYRTQRYDNRRFTVPPPDRIELCQYTRYILLRFVSERPPPPYSRFAKEKLKPEGKCAKTAKFFLLFGRQQ